MTLKELAHSAQQHLQTLAGVPVKRSYVHELLAAAFRSESLLANAGVGDALAGKSPQLIGRAVQLGYGQAASVLLADAVVAFAMARQVSCIRWMDVRDALAVAPVLVDENRLDDEKEEWDDEDEAPRSAPIAGPDPHRFLSSPLLVDSLEQMAACAAGEVHQVLATMYRCKRPNPYLYEESLKGRQLTRIEQGWVDGYLVAEPRFRKYEAHLKAAALGGVRPAAVEYAAVFDSREFFELAERMAGDVDADRVAQIAATPDSRAAWLRTAAEGGSESALRQLARGGDAWAQERLAEHGDVGALRDMAERAVEHGDLMKAWSWQHLALLHGVDLTVSTMRVYHDSGPQHGEYYDSDFGGAPRTLMVTKVCACHPWRLRRTSGPGRWLAISINAPVSGSRCRTKVRGRIRWRCRATCPETAC
jgi:hypothetical protein